MGASLILVYSVSSLVTSMLTSMIVNVSADLRQSLIKIVVQSKMPVNSNRFNRFLVGLGLGLAITSSASAAIPQLPSEHYDWLADRIFANECNRQLRCLSHWNSGEDFPSLGIGHFIWYREGQQEPFEETFPTLLLHLQRSGVALPSWLNPPLNADNPWPDRDNFMDEMDSPRLVELRALLEANMGLQASFIAQRLEFTLDDIIASFPASRQESIENIFSDIAGQNSPLGLYALIDYLHFKGSGLKASERYAGQGWGLRQVVERMSGHDTSLQAFVDAATATLENRVDNAPPERNESRWLQGWINRLHTYLP